MPIAAICGLQWDCGAGPSEISTQLEERIVPLVVPTLSDDSGRGEAGAASSSDEVRKANNTYTVR